MAATIAAQYKQVAQLGLLESIKAGLLQPTSLAAITALTPVATANATDLATAIALANANKTAINAIIAALKV